MVSHARIFRTVASVLVVVMLVGMMVFDSAIGWLVAPVVVGGALLALLQYWANRHGHEWGTSGDIFAQGAPATDVINMTSIKVAGMGGLGLVILSAVVALNFRLTAVALVLGLTGGTLGALLVILYRRRHGPMGSSSQGPGARVVFEDRRQPHDEAAPLGGWRGRSPRLDVAPAFSRLR